MERISGALEDRYCIYSELPAVVSIQARRIAYASTWASLDDIYWEPLVCPYYYLVTDAVGGLSDADLERFVSDHREIFRSAAPFDPDRSRPLAVFVQLNERASD
jgi:hypothetical protein